MPMKTLLLLRHAKSDWSDPCLADFDRPLASRGRKAAARMAAWMQERGWLPDRVLCSPARRAIETWNLAAPHLACDPEVRSQRTLYLASPAQILRQVRHTPEHCKNVLVIGHNPGLEELCRGLAGPKSNEKALDRLAEKFPTAALARVRCAVDGWGRFDPDSARLTHLLRPKDRP